MGCPLMNPNVKMLLNLRRVRNIRRCNNFPTLFQENVAAHSYFVVQLTMVIADEANDLVPGAVDVEKALRRAILHDTMESFTSDIPWNVKHYSDASRDVIHQVEDDMMSRIADSSNLFQRYLNDVSHCKDGLEGQIVNLADMLELALFCYEEVTGGNAFMTDMLRKTVDLCEGYISSMPCEIFNEHSVVVQLLEVLKDTCRWCGNFSPLNID